MFCGMSVASHRHRREQRADLRISAPRNAALTLRGGREIPRVPSPSSWDNPTPVTCMLQLDKAAAVPDVSLITRQPCEPCRLTLSGAATGVAAVHDGDSQTVTGLRMPRTERSAAQRTDDGHAADERGPTRRLPRQQPFAWLVVVLVPAGPAAKVLVVRLMAIGTASAPSGFQPRLPGGGGDSQRVGG